ncbi:hypothetical protein KFK09_015503 [Dendrobium nobile]|uniref:Uncharacterized protein n=1 Tax=Dendrobium nobile TaxID=94219 RepID=A0A8T3B656_DENNO|nr:hypothetical protein KFK09_015503 [Dendrobium nobile]
MDIALLERPRKTAKSGNVYLVEESGQFGQRKRATIGKLNGDGGKEDRHWSTSETQNMFDASFRASLFSNRFYIQEEHSSFKNSNNWYQKLVEAIMGKEEDVLVIKNGPEAARFLTQSGKVESGRRVCIGVGASSTSARCKGAIASHMVVLHEWSGRSGLSYLVKQGWDNGVQVKKGVKISCSEIDRDPHLGVFYRIADGYKDIQFEVGERVFLTLRPYRQRAVANRRNEKVAPRKEYRSGYPVKKNCTAYKTVILVMPDDDQHLQDNLFVL